MMMLVCFLVAQKQQETKMVVEARRSILLLFMWFLMKGDSCSFVVISSCHR